VNAEPEAVPNRAIRVAQPHAPDVRVLRGQGRNETDPPVRGAVPVRLTATKQCPQNWHKANQATHDEDDQRDAVHVVKEVAIAPLKRRYHRNKATILGL